MTDQEIRAGIFAALRRIAPEADPGTIEPDVSLRDQLDVDSMDLLSFIIRLHQQFGVEIPELDYARLATIDSSVAYLQERLSAIPPPQSDGGSAPDTARTPSTGAAMLKESSEVSTSTEGKTSR